MMKFSFRVFEKVMVLLLQWMACEKNAERNIWSPRNFNAAFVWSVVNVPVSSNLLLLGLPVPGFSFKGIWVKQLLLLMFNKDYAYLL